MDRQQRVRELAALAFDTGTVDAKLRKAARRDLRHLLTSQIKERSLSASVRVRSTNGQLWAYAKKIATAMVARERVDWKQH